MVPGEFDIGAGGDDDDDDRTVGFLTAGRCEGKGCQSYEACDIRTPGSVSGPRHGR